MKILLFLAVLLGAILLLAVMVVAVFGADLHRAERDWRDEEDGDKGPS